jgi:hypothetical protein
LQALKAPAHRFVDNDYPTDDELEDVRSVFHRSCEKDVRLVDEAPPCGCGAARSPETPSDCGQVGLGSFVTTLAKVELPFSSTRLF